jgi:hypothetical protein
MVKECILGVSRKEFVGVKIWSGVDVKKLVVKECIYKEIRK